MSFFLLLVWDKFKVKIINRDPGYFIKTLQDMEYIITIRRDTENVTEKVLEYGIHDRESNRVKLIR